VTAELTEDLFFGGRLRLLQTRRGHRAGTDAALLIAAARSRLSAGAAVADLGAGTGAVGLGLAMAGAGHAALVEIDPDLAALARENAALNDLAGRTLIETGDAAMAGAQGSALAAGSYDLVASNPPFDSAARFRPSPDADKARAHVAEPGLLDGWIRAAARLLRPGGSVVLIHRPEALAEALSGLGRRFGEIRVKPVHPRTDAPAARVLIAARKGSRAPFALLPPLVLHGENGGFTPEADAAQRGDAALAV
jgi:tRNA1(Val) A37 N6-methylase TrmN6